MVEQINSQGFRRSKCYKIRARKCISDVKIPTERKYVIELAFLSPPRSRTPGSCYGSTESICLPPACSTAIGNVKAIVAIP